MTDWEFADHSWERRGPQLSKKKKQKMWTILDAGASGVQRRRPQLQITKAAKKQTVLKSQCLNPCSQLPKKTKKTKTVLKSQCLNPCVPKHL
jgi:hypothetical protein